MTPGPFGIFNKMGYITIASTGNAQDFGDLSLFTNNYDGGYASSVRGSCWFWVL